MRAWGFWAFGAVTMVCALFSGGCEALGIPEACGDDEFGATYCDGNRVWVCCAEDRVWELQENCGSLSCVEQNTGAVCVSEDDRHPRCDWYPASEHELHSFCEGNTIVKCNFDGYAEPEVACDDPAQPSTAKFCSEANDAPFCAESAEPDSVCWPDANAVRCDGSAIVTCREGYRVHTEQCESCVDTEYAPPFCALSAEPEPSCDLTSLGQEVCVDNEKVRCVFGYRVEAVPCGEGDTCVEESATVATCGKSP